MENNNKELNGVKKMIADGIVTQEAAEKYFPELKENEDELKWLTKFIEEEARCLSMDIRDDEDRIKLKNLQKSLAWLEKQGEHKPTDKYNIRGIKSKHAEGKLGEMIKNLKSSDKAEPKFHEGQWVVDKEGHIFQITRIDKDYNGITYACRLIENPIFWSLYYEDEIRLWDIIKDAKTGDALVASDGSIFLFAGVVDCACKYYVALTTSNDVKINKEVEGGYWETSRAVHPANKEQRDNLLKAMDEAGWDFDFEKKELKKIKPIDEYEGLTDFERAVADACIGFIDKDLVGWKQYVKDSADDLLKIAVKMFNKVHPKEWSDEDERILRTIISDGIRGAEIDMLQINWLKAIKKRVACEAKCTTAKQWKPSEEQIAELEFFISDLPKCSVVAQKIIKKGKDTLVSLLSDLKKLREE